MNPTSVHMTVALRYCHVHKYYIRVLTLAHSDIPTLLTTACSGLNYSSPKQIPDSRYLVKVCSKGGRGRDGRLSSY